MDPRLLRHPVSQEPLKLEKKLYMLYVHKNERLLRHTVSQELLNCWALFYTEIIAAADTICSFKKTIKNERSIYYLRWHTSRQTEIRL